MLTLARLYRAALDHLGVTGLPKVTGKRGIQVWVPVKPIYTYRETSDWVEALSRAIGATVPKLVSWQWAKSSRSGLARLDYTQNAVNKTLVAPYAVRPVADAAVSAPITLGRAGRSRPAAGPLEHRDDPAAHRGARRPVRAGARNRAGTAARSAEDSLPLTGGGRARRPRVCCVRTEGTGG